MTKKLDGNLIRETQGHRSLDKYARIENPLGEILKRFETRSGSDPRKGGGDYEPTPEEAAIIHEAIYGVNGMGRKFQEANHTISDDARHCRYEQCGREIYSLDNGMLHGRTALGNSRRVY